MIELWCKYSIAWWECNGTTKQPLLFLRKQNCTRNLFHKPKQVKPFWNYIFYPSHFRVSNLTSINNEMMIPLTFLLSSNSNWTAKRVWSMILDPDFNWVFSIHEPIKSKHVQKRIGLNVILLFWMFIISQLSTPPFLSSFANCFTHSRSNRIFQFE